MGLESASWLNSLSSTDRNPTEFRKISQKYEKDQDSSLDLIETGGAYRLVTKPQFAAILKEYSKAPINQSLSRAALETLSIIAYKQPITRIEIDAIRGLIPSGAISKVTGL